MTDLVPIGGTDRPTVPVPLGVCMAELERERVQANRLQYRRDYYRRNRERIRAYHREHYLRKKGRA